MADSPISEAAKRAWPAHPVQGQDQDTDSPLTNLTDYWWEMVGSIPEPEQPVKKKPDSPILSANNFAPLSMNEQATMVPPWSRSPIVEMVQQTQKLYTKPKVLFSPSWYPESQGYEDSYIASTSRLQSRCLDVANARRPRNTLVFFPWFNHSHSELRRHWPIQFRNLTATAKKSPADLPVVAFEQDSASVSSCSLPRSSMELVTDSHASALFQSSPSPDPLRRLLPSSRGRLCLIATTETASREYVP